MTIEISTNPHSFIAFMTLAMGIAYVFFHPNSQFGVTRLLTLLFLIVPIALMGYQLGHTVDILLGGVIGFATARGIRIPSLTDAIRSRYFGWKLNRILRSHKKEWDAATESQQEAEAEAKAQARAEEAKRERQRQEQQRQEDANQRRSSSTNGSQSQNSQRQQHSDNSKTGHQQYQKPRVDPELARALSTLGVSETASLDEAKLAYRRLCKEFHPDAQAGASESVKKMAEEKMKEINVAMSVIRSKLK